MNFSLCGIDFSFSQIAVSTANYTVDFPLDIKLTYDIQHIRNEVIKYAEVIEDHICYVDISTQTFKARRKQLAYNWYMCGVLASHCVRVVAVTPYDIRTWLGLKGNRKKEDVWSTFEYTKGYSFCHSWNEHQRDAYILMHYGNEKEAREI